MNIDNLLSVVSQLNTGKNAEPELSGKLQLADFITQNLKLDTGQKLVLEINGTTLNLTDVTGKTLQVPTTSLLLDKIQFNEPVQIEAKITSQQGQNLALDIKAINGKPISTYLRQEGKISTITEQSAVIVKDLTGTKNIPLQNIKLKDIAKPFLNEFSLTSEQQSELQKELQQIEVKVQIKNVSQETTKNIQTEILPIQQKIKESLGELSIKLSDAPRTQIENIIQNTVADLSLELQQVRGQLIPAMITEDGFSSPLGIIHPEIPISLPEETFVELEITDIMNTGSSKQALPTSSVDNILKSIKKLEIDNPQLYEKITAKLPADNENMLQNMVAFTKAAVKNDIRHWLGNDIVTELENKGDAGKTVLTELQNTLQGNNRQSPLWRVIEIPYYVENHMEQIRLAIKQYPDEEENENTPKEKFGTRFIVDTNFTQLGAFQFDGFSFAKDCRFDLIIRTARYIEDDLYTNIMRIFKQTLNDVQYVGNIKINLKENFIKISENNTDDNVLARGLFI